MDRLVIDVHMRGRSEDNKYECRDDVGPPPWLLWSLAWAERAADRAAQAVAALEDAHSAAPTMQAASGRWLFARAGTPPSQGVAPRCKATPQKSACGVVRVPNRNLEFYDRSRGVPGGGGTPGAAPVFGLCRPTPRRATLER